MFRNIRPGPFAPGIHDIGRESPTKAYLPARNGRPPEPVPPGFLSGLGGGKVPEPPIEATTSGGRTALANWIATKDNPLFARVMVNRIWHFHFGRGLVATPSDLGSPRRAAVPSRTARLAGHGVRGQRMVDEEAAQADHDVQRLPPERARSRRRPMTATRTISTSRTSTAGGCCRKRFATPCCRAPGALNLKMAGRPVVPEVAREELYGLSGNNMWQVTANVEEQSAAASTCCRGARSGRRCSRASSAGWHPELLAASGEQHRSAIAHLLNGSGRCRSPTAWPRSSPASPMMPSWRRRHGWRCTRGRRARKKSAACKRSWNGRPRSWVKESRGGRTGARALQHQRISLRGLNCDETLLPDGNC